MDYDIERRNFLKGLGATAAGTGATGTAVGHDAPKRKKGDADLVLYNAEVRTVDKNDRIVEAIAIKDGVIQDVGNNQPVRERFVGDDTEELDLDGYTVIPGLQDSHIHLQEVAPNLEFRADLTYATSQEELIELLHEHVEEKGIEEGEWIRGTRWVEQNYPEGMVTRWQLDEEFPDNPVYTTRAYRGVAVNTEVFNRMGIKDNDPETWPDWWLEDPDNLTFEDKILREEREIETVNGETIVEEIPTGVFIGNGGWGAGNLPDLEQPPSIEMGPTEALDKGSDALLRNGVVSINNAISWHGEAFRKAREELFPLRTHLWHGGFAQYEESPPPFIEETLEEFEERGWFGGDRWFKQVGAKFLHDGGTDVRSSANARPFEVLNEGVPNFGNLHDRDWEREAMMQVPGERGYQLHAHAIGADAMRQAMDIYKRYYEGVWDVAPDSDARFSIEHAETPMEEDVRLNPDEPNTVLEDMAKYNVIASCQPVFFWQLAGAILETMGEDRLSRTQPWQSYIDGGVTVAAGTDAPIAPHNPGPGFYGLMTRKTLGTDSVYGPEERVSVADALRMWTYNGAYFTHEEDIRGSLERGKVADLVVLDVESLDTFEEDPEKLFEWEDLVQWTLVEGITGYQAEEFNGPTEDPVPPEEDLPDSAPSKAG